jgi:single-strand DNA-binding protein
MNKVYLIGRLTNAPEQRQTQNGVSVCTFSIAVNRRMNREVTDYFNIVAWRGLAETCTKYLVKGQRVAVCGELQTRSYEDKNGVKRYVTEVVCDDVEFLDKPSVGSDDNFPTQAKKTAQNESGGFAQAAEMDEMEVEDLPF